MERYPVGALVVVGHLKHKAERLSYTGVRGVVSGHNRAGQIEVVLARDGVQCWLVAGEVVCRPHFAERAWFKPTELELAQ